MKQKIAKIISFIGHPLLTIPLFVIVVMFTSEDLKSAAFVSLLVIGGIFVPLGLMMYVKSRNGSFTNFDVSDRKQRKSMFWFVLPLLIVVTIILYVTGQSKSVCLSLFFGLVIAFVSQIANLFIKSSLHVSSTIYLSFMIMPVNFKIGVLVFMLTGLIGWSRIVLGRHTLKEVLFGGGIGLVISLIMFYVVSL